MSVVWNYVLPGILGLALLYWFFRPGREDASTHVPLPAKNERAAVKPNILLPGTSATPESSASSLAKARKSYDSMVYAGIKRVPVTSDGKGLLLQMRTKVDGTNCNVGDFDHLKSLVKSADEKIFLLTVEKMEKPRSVVGSYRMGLTDITLGKALGYSIPSSNHLDYYGVYLCSADKSSKSCGGKAPMTVRDWRNASVGKRRLGKAIYFQMIAANKDGLFLLPSDKWDDKTLKGLEKALGEGQTLSKRAYKRMKYMLGRLGSVGASVSGAGLEIVLSYRKADCD